MRIIPVRKTKGGELDLRALLEGVDQSALIPLQKTIEAKSVSDFSTGYKQALEACYSCRNS